MLIGAILYDAYLKMMIELTHIADILSLAGFIYINEKTAFFENMIKIRTRRVLKTPAVIALALLALGVVIELWGFSPRFPFSFG